MTSMAAGSVHVEIVDDTYSICSDGFVRYEVSLGAEDEDGAVRMRP